MLVFIESYSDYIIVVVADVITKLEYLILNHRKGQNPRWPKGERRDAHAGVPVAPWRKLHRQRATLPKNFALTSVGGELRLANGVTLLAKFGGDFASNSSTYGGTGTFRYRW